MADIDIACEQCGNRFAVSEYASGDGLKCAKCGAVVKVPERVPDKPVGAKLRLAHPTEPPPAPVPDPPAGKQRRTPRLRHPRAGRIFSPGPWVVFLLLAAVLAWLRFKAALSPEVHEYLWKGGVGLILFFHVTILVHAFTEDIFHGVLCLVIPGYTMYYLFVFSDMFYLRAVVAALLIAFGYDTYGVVRKAGYATYNGITHWMQTTGSVAQQRVDPK